MSVFTDRKTDAESSVDIEEQAKVRLQHSQYRAIRKVTCRFDAGVLTLEGHVPTFHYKQLAQTAVADIQGVHRVINEIQVHSPS
jgi:osmotically-inducible protein OsmY